MKTIVKYSELQKNSLLNLKIDERFGALITEIQKFTTKSP